ncbi:MAG TPA: TlpA disulfide reductase family protein [Gemmataceae bacterium]|jgi:thiol-disulfide isomerase/thioredoxin|nr:TlpA disulfide reductase family protein [Gemmataceae bacterium]
MKRVFSQAAVAMLIMAAGLWAQDKPKDKPDDKKPTMAERFDSIVKDWERMRDVLGKDLDAEFGKAKTDEEREKLMEQADTKFLALTKPFTDKALALAKEDLKDLAAVNCLLFAIMAGRNEEAAAAFVDSQMETVQFPEACGVLAARGADNPAAVKVLQLVVDKAKNKDLKGNACIGLAQMYYQRSEEPKVAADPKKVAESLKQAEEMAEKVKKEYADVKSPVGELGKVADKVLFEIRNLAIGKSAPEVVSKDLNDKEVKLSSLNGNVVVLDIWATWCGPCRQMIPHERELVEKLKGKPFVFVSISADDEKKTLTDFLEKQKMPWTHWWEGRKETGILKDWNVRFFPTIYILDSKGVIRYKNVRGKKMDEAVEKLLAEMGKS